MIELVCIPKRIEDKLFIRYSMDGEPYCAVFFDGYDTGVNYRLKIYQNNLTLDRSTGKLVPVLMKDELINIVTKGGRLGYN